MLDDNKQFANFRDQLEAKGYGLIPIWETDQLYCFGIMRDPGVPEPEVPNIIISDQGAQGFLLWFASPNNRIDDDVELIIRGVEY